MKMKIEKRNNLIALYRKLIKELNWLNGVTVHPKGKLY